jgi:cytochrome oxidase Cu insertion factor (SCO1/SenC/PrrC family)
VMASSRTGDQLAAGDLSLLGRGGQVDLGSHGGRVPKAPDTLRLAAASVAPGSYSGLRVGAVSLPAAITVTGGQVVPVLIGVQDGTPLAGGVWAGNDDFNLGLSELAGQKTPLQDFNLVDEQGRPFTAASLAGSDALIAAFHTTCHETCPIYTGLFLQLRDRVPAGTRLVEVTTDPAVDTPAVLRQYAAETGASWTLATGEPAELARFWSQFGTLLSGEDEHTSTLVLVDRHGYVRVVYRGVPDVGGSLPSQLSSRLSPTGLAELRQKGLDWGAPQVLDALHSIASLAPVSDAAGGPAPDFKLQRLNGGTLSLADLRGRPVVLNFFASWCPPCRSELPLLQRDAAAHPGVTYLLVATRDDPAQAKALLARLGVSAPAAAEDPEGTAADAYGAFGLPTTVFIRRDGTIAARVARQLDPGTLDADRSALEAG